MAIPLFSIIMFPSLTLPMTFFSPTTDDLISDDPCGYLRMATNEGGTGKTLPEGEKKAPENGNYQKQRLKIRFKELHHY